MVYFITNWAEPQNSPIVLELAGETLEIIIGYVYQMQTVYRLVVFGF